MKTKVLLTAFAASAIILTSCDDDNIPVGSSLKKAFRSQYPKASRVEWEMKAGFYVAEFNLRGTDAEAWYSPDATWHMTETDIRYSDLPEAVLTAFAAGEYSGWWIDDADKLERTGLETVYVIEAEQGGTEYDLYYSEDGILIKAVPDNGGSHNYLPSPVSPASIDEFIGTDYPGARILEKEIEHGKIEVDIVHNGVATELLFTLEGEWISAKTEMRFADVPETVKEVLSGSQYGGWRVDDVDFYDTPAVDYYKFELESGDREADLRIDTQGNILQ